MIPLKHHHPALPLQSPITPAATILEGYRVRADPIEEPPVVRHDQHAAGEAVNSLLEAPESVDVEIIRRLVCGTDRRGKGGRALVLHALADRPLETGPREDGAFFQLDRSPMAERWGSQPCVRKAILWSSCTTNLPRQRREKHVRFSTTATAWHPKREGASKAPPLVITTYHCQANVPSETNASRSSPSWYVQRRLLSSHGTNARKQQQGRLPPRQASGLEPRSSCRPLLLAVLRETVKRNHSSLRHNPLSQKPLRCLLSTSSLVSLSSILPPASEANQTR